MKIYIMPAWYPQNENDITASFFREQAHALAERGHEITVIHIEPVSVTFIGKKPLHQRRVWQDDAVRTIFHKVIIPFPAKLGDIQDRYISEVFCDIIGKQIAEDEEQGEKRPDILHAHVSHSCAFYCLLAAKRLSVPLVVTEHYSGLLLGTATPREYQRVKETIEGADAFIFVGTNFQREVCEKLKINRKTYVIPNMLPDAKEKNSKVSGQHDPFTYLAACHLTENKSIDLLIKAFHQAFSQGERVQLLIAGDGNEREKLEKLAVDLRETNRVHFLGRYSREESEGIFSKADVFVLTSRVETFGIVYIEAMQQGLPCIGTKGQGAEDIITPENGILVEYGDDTALEKAMIRIKNEYCSYDRERISEMCRMSYSPSFVSSKIVDVYQRIGGSKTLCDSGCVPSEKA